VSNLLERLIEHGLFTNDFDRRFSDICFSPGDPTQDIGLALRLARFYNIELHSGMTRWSVRAVYEYPGREPLWFDRATVQEAVCVCAIVCAEEGIIRRNLDYRLEPYRCGGEE